MGEQEDTIYPPGTIVFAKLKGYPWWPAKIEDEREVPAKVMKQKTKTKSPIWTVFFFGSRDYGFFGPDSIRPFDKANVEKDLKAKKFKTKDLELAVREALNPSLMERHDEQDEPEDSEEEELAREKKKKKKQPKATTKTGKKTPGKKAMTSEKDMDTRSTNSGGSISSSGSGNNNKRSISDEDKSDMKKRRKSMSIENEDQVSNGSDRPSASPATPRKSESQDPQKRLYHLRHRLQKLMYEKKQGDIPLDDYSKISITLKEVEDSAMTYELLRSTKIGKVVKCGTVYEFENDTEYNLQERCQQLMRTWKEKFVDTKDKTNDTTTMDNKPSSSQQE